MDEVGIIEEPLEDGGGVYGLPSKFSTWRPHQAAVTTEIIKDLSTGKRFVIAEMPTGSGKTMISMAANQLIDGKTLYVCTTKSLQDQFINDFPHAKLIKGRSNYPCGVVPKAFPTITADDCPAEKCRASCPYKIAKDQALTAPLTVMNMSYFLSELQHVGKFGGRQLVVIDECDTVEDALLDQVSVQISMGDVKALGLGTPQYKTKFESWKTWAEQSKDIVLKRSEALRREIALHQHTDDQWETVPVDLIREKKRYDRMTAKLKFFLKYVDQYWVWEEVKGIGRFPTKWIFKPVRVDQFGDILFGAAQSFILMSATILDFFQYERNIGLAKYRETGEVATIRLGSVFDPERRPIKVVEGIDLTYKNKAEGMKLLPAAVKKILDAHPNEKGLIHAVTYEISNALLQSFPGRLMSHTPSSRRDVIQEFKSTDRPAVLVSPSADRGEDFPDDVCRFIIIAKIPYPYLGDERIKKRLYHKDGQNWYTLKTVSKLIQMTGRGMRHEEDRCVSYILDSGFRKLYLANKRLFPQWWKDALHWEALTTHRITPTREVVGAEPQPAPPSRVRVTQEGAES